MRWRQRLGDWHQQGQQAQQAAGCQEGHSPAPLTQLHVWQQAGQQQVFYSGVWWLQWLIRGRGAAGKWLAKGPREPRARAVCEPLRLAVRHL